jgi:hypothetical protein
MAFIDFEERSRIPVDDERPTLTTHQVSRVREIRSHGLKGVLHRPVVVDDRAG